jgi:hypothetical protein
MDAQDGQELEENDSPQGTQRPQRKGTLDGMGTGLQSGEPRGVTQFEQGATPGRLATGDTAAWQAALRIRD